MYAIIAENLNNKIPLNMWQQVSGSKTNANVNEAIATPGADPEN